MSDCSVKERLWEFEEKRKWADGVDGEEEEEEEGNRKLKG